MLPSPKPLKPDSTFVCDAFDVMYTNIWEMSFIHIVKTF